MSVLSQSISIINSFDGERPALWEDSLYQGQIVGVVAAERTKFQSTDLQTQIRVVMIFENDSEQKLLSSRWFATSLNPKSNCYKFFCKMTKTNSPETCLEALNKLCGGSFAPDKLIGVPVTGYIVKTSFQGQEGPVEINDIESVTPGKTAIIVKDFTKPKWVAVSVPVEQVWVPCAKDAVDSPNAESNGTNAKSEPQKIRQAAPTPPTDIDAFFAEPN